MPSSYRPDIAWQRLTEMVEHGWKKNGNGNSFHLTTAQIGIGLTLLGYGATGIFAFAHQESRISLIEADILNNKRRISENNRDITNLSMQLLMLERQINRLDTPLSRRVIDDEARINDIDQRVRLLERRPQ